MKNKPLFHTTVYTMASEAKYLLKKYGENRKQFVPNFMKATNVSQKDAETCYEELWRRVRSSRR